MSDQNRPTINPPGNTPIVSIVTAAALIVCGLVAVAYTKNEAAMVVVIGLIVSTVPSLIASGFSERSSRDIRNGVVKDKVVDALEETGVAGVARDASQTTPAALSALNMLLTQIVADNNARGARTTHRDQDTP